MYGSTTYRSAGAETSLWMAAIDILLRWSKDRGSGVAMGLQFVQLNQCNEPISYTELTLVNFRPTDTFNK